MYTGGCNGCGRCCTATHIDPVLGVLESRCLHLVEFRNVGLPQATTCAVYEKRYLGMPITMLVQGIRFSYPSFCYSTYPDKRDAIPPECSYNWAGTDAQPRWHLSYAPRLPLVQIMEKSLG